MNSKKTRTFKKGDKITAHDIAQTIDHSLLRPDITVKELIDGCEIAEKYDCVSVCVRPSDLPIVVKELAGTQILVTTVASFPHGTCTTDTKIFETKDAIEKGAQEVDVVMNIARFLSEEYDYVENELHLLANTAHQLDALLKVIFENHYLSSAQIKAACIIAERAGVDFVKTSTGYAASGAKIEDLKVMRASCSPKVQVKAAGGIRTLDNVLEILATGAARVGTRSTEAIMEEAAAREKVGKLVIPEV